MATQKVNLEEKQVLWHTIQDKIMYISNVPFLDILLVASSLHLDYHGLLPQTPVIRLQKTPALGNIYLLTFAFNFLNLVFWNVYGIGQFRK